MKKIIIILSLMILSYASPVFSDECPYWDTTVWCGAGTTVNMTAGVFSTNNIISGTTNANYNIMGWYASSTLATEACVAWYGGGCNAGTNGITNTLTSGTASGVGVKSGYKSSNLGGNYYSTVRQYYLYNNGAFVYVEDDFNPFPDSAIFRWKEVGRQYDSEGNVIGQLIQFQNPVTGETITEYFGDLPSEHCTEGQIQSGACPITLVLNDYWRPGSEFNDLYGSSDVGSSSPFSPIGHIDQQATVDGVDTEQTGVGDSGSTDTELLQNIATNTRFNTANQQILSSQLTELTNTIIEGNNMAGQIGASVAGGIGMSNSLLADIRDGIEGLETGSGGAGAADIGEAVGDALTEQIDFTGQTGDEWGVIRGQLEAYRTELGIPLESEYYPEGEINTPEDFTARMEGLFADTESGSLFQGVKSVLSTNRLTASGSCSASVSIWGQSVDLTVCGMAGALEVFGQILVGLATIAAILIAFRG